MRSNRPTAVALLAAMTLIVQPSAATAAPEPIRVASTTDAVDPAKSVTLITGDTVTMTRQADGKVSTLIKPGAGREKIAFSTRAVNKHVHVIPSDANRLLAAGRLDPRLFDVTQLVEFGYDDVATASLPLIVTGAGAGVSALSGARVTRQLPSVGGVALAESKKDASAFWRSLAGGGFAAANAGKVWLSGKAKLLDADSNAQIGVPAARAAGYDGKGVTVAVLDSGIDATHPDVKSVLGETKDFTGSPDGVKDNHGHGTHVASTIVGTGTQNAAYGGVAPGATLMVGKVCGSEFCDDAAIIDGMEWAAGKARIVNLSLGSSDGADGSDPIAQALNKLTESTGTLFVAAAGNSYSSYTVGSPAAADAALAVASVDRSDAVSDFSSKGPRVGDHSVKPDIAAPGEGIVAARAAGTSMGNPAGEFYTAASGTSMASPHVAGVAALLAQARPGWKADKLKAALMSSSAVPAGLGVFESGAGRVDAARAVSQTVFAEGSVSFPYATWPRTNTTTSKAVTYRNEGSSPVTLSLALSGSDAFTLGSSTVTVPAGGTAQATVVLDAAKLPTAGGASSARVTATAGDVSVRTAVGAAAEPESYDVQVTVIDRNGKPANGSVGLFNHTRLIGSDRDVDVVDGVGTVRLPVGDYGVVTDTATPADDSSGTAASVTMQVVPKVSVKEGTTITLDARKGVKTSISVADRPGAVRQTISVDYILDMGPGSLSGGLFAGIGDPQDLYVVPVAAASGTTLAYGLSAVLASPKGTAKPYQYYLVMAAPLGSIPDNPVWTVRTKDLAERQVRFRAQGKPADAEFARSPLYLQGQFFIFGAWNMVSMPITRTDYISPAPRWSSTMAFQRPAGEPRTAPFGFVNDMTDKFAAGRPTGEEWNKAAVGPGLGVSPNYSAGIVRSGENFYAYVPMFSPAAPNQGNMVAFQYAFATGDTSLALEGHDPVSSGAPGIGAFAGLPAGKSRYTLAASATRNESNGWHDLATTTEATWTFSSSVEDNDLLPLMHLRTTGAFDDLNRARPGLFSLTVDVLRQPRSPATTAKVRKVTVEYSTDDGKTWKRAPVVVGSGNSWRAVLVNPRSGLVSLRTTATDSAGDSHTSTVIRAYRIK